MAKKESAVLTPVVKQDEFASLAAVNSVGTQLHQLEIKVDDNRKNEVTAIATLGSEMDQLKAEVRELAQLIALQFGEPFTSQSRAIIKRHNGA